MESSPLTQEVAWQDCADRTLTFFSRSMLIKRAIWERGSMTPGNRAVDQSLRLHRRECTVEPGESAGPRRSGVRGQAASDEAARLVFVIRQDVQ